MTSNGSRLELRPTDDGSFSLFSPQFGEGFHSRRGAMAEARSKFVAPAGLERWQRGSRLRVLDVCVGTGSNTAALLEACQAQGLTLEWWGLELDPEPLRLAVADAGFQRQWQPEALAALHQLADGPDPADQTHQTDQNDQEDQQEAIWQVPGLGGGRLLWGDARRRLPELLDSQRGCIDLVLMDAFSPSRCPQLWSIEFLGGLGTLLHPEGRLLTYCSAAAVRQALRQVGLELATIAAPSGLQQHQSDWSGGTAASPRPFPADGRLRPLSSMEEEHLRTNAAEPYRDPSGTADARAILQERQRAQQQAMQTGSVEATSSWRRRWGLSGLQQG